MLDAILGRKVGMTQIFDDQGEVVAVTVIEAGPCVVTQLKTVDREGYAAVQVGYGATRKVLVNRPEAGHFKKCGVEPARYLREIRVTDTGEFQPGSIIKCDIFQPGERVRVTGQSKGKGFAGVVKRFHFHGANMTHGSMIHRKPQSSGATDAARTFKGTRKPGHMGAVKATVRGLRVARVDPDRNLLFVEGAIPGCNGGLVTVQRMRTR